MAYEYVSAFNANLTADGGADGFATLASNTGAYPGMKGWIVDDNSAPQRVLLVELNGSTKIGLRFIADENLGPIDDPAVRGTKSAYQSMGRTPLAAFTLAQNAKVSFEAQVVPVQQPVFNPSPRPV